MTHSFKYHLEAGDVFVAGYFEPTRSLNWTAPEVDFVIESVYTMDNKPYKPTREEEEAIIEHAVIDFPSAKQDQADYLMEDR